MQSSEEKFFDGGAPYLWQRRTSFAVIALYPLVHIAAVWSGLLLTSGTQTATLWPANAVLLAVMVMLDRRWWLYLLGSLLAAEAFTITFLLPHLSLAIGLYFSAANMLEVLVAAFLWQGLVKERINVFRLRDCILLVFVVALTAPALSGLIAGLGRVSIDGVFEFLDFWQLWWSGNALGILVISTTILAWAGISRGDWRLPGSRWFELCVLVLSALGLAVFVFSSQPGSVGTALGLPYIVFPLLVWSAVRFGTRVSTGLVLLISVIAIINTDSGNGPYAIPSYSVYQRVLSLQMFLAAAAISALILGAAFSERRIALRFLRGSEDKFSKAFHSSPDAICICRVSDGRVMDVNNSFRGITSYTRQEAIGATLQQLKLLPLEEQRRKYLEQGELIGLVVQINSLVAAKSGATRECEIAYDLAEIEGDLCMVCILHDVTRIRAEEEKRLNLEAELMQTKKMEAIGQSTSGIAHDFNNILFNILGNTELAEIRAASLHDRKLTGYLREIHQGGTRARDVVAQLLAFGRSEPINPLPVNVAELLDEVLDDLGQIMPTSLLINTSIKTPKVKVLADPVQVQRAVMNLCINARDAMDGKGTIDIELDVAPHFRGLCSSCQQSFEGEFACLSICDSGPGIAAEAQAKIFEPFYTSKDAGKGTGLGLSVVHGVVHGHSGHIVIVSTPGKTKISSYFPLLPADTVAVDPSPPDNSLRKEAGSMVGNVLLVDDEAAVLNVTVQILERYGLDVTAATSGADALSLFEEDPGAFDLVITDQTMPHMTGAIMAKKMLAIRSDLPVILCSGYSADIDASRAHELGLRGYHQKPLDFRSLVQQIGDLLGA